MPKLTKNKIRYFKKDERKAVREYKKYGLNRLAKDEQKHYNYLDKINPTGLTKTQQKLVARKIRKEHRYNLKKPLSERRSRKQLIAIGFSKAREQDPEIPEVE